MHPPELHGARLLMPTPVAPRRHNTVPGRIAVHKNAPLSVEGRRRLVERCRTRPIAHAAEMGISRATAAGDRETH
jgi:hypothetical protein